VIDSVGLSLKLELVQSAVPTIFQEIKQYKENNTPSSVSHLGPPQRKRTTYDGFVKKEQKDGKSYFFVFALIYSYSICKNKTYETFHLLV
jgi:hypothetical protein